MRKLGVRINKDREKRIWVSLARVLIWNKGKMHKSKARQVLSSYHLKRNEIQALLRKWHREGRIILHREYVILPFDLDLTILVRQR